MIYHRLRSLVRTFFLLLTQLTRYWRNWKKYRIRKLSWQPYMPLVKNISNNYLMIEKAGKNVSLQYKHIFSAIGYKNAIAKTIPQYSKLRYVCCENDWMMCSFYFQCHNRQFQHFIIILHKTIRSHSTYIYMWNIFVIKLYILLPLI